uniref:NADH-ubiquinone oxidoreductase chain 3 n=1 Tax=Bombus filchnerae TaxID=395525 RepID=A0A8E5HHS4_9HYME|nr:NADH dehydrogenase subunit 3 [Bombus filchnerae]QTZ18840.1 NADH dehydrogenase subunit 3 [Bombus filchnerae]WKW52607.1 NADH dehydrogenase subunit 3 [Bombus filchnerae]
MNIQILYLILIFLILFIIIILNKFLSMFKKLNFEKNLPYECGFNPITKINIPFSLPFYLISLTFLIFDIEIILLIPLILFLKTFNSLYLFMLIFFFFIMLIFSLFMEWSCNFLNWMF